MLKEVYKDKGSVQARVGDGINRFVSFPSKTNAQRFITQILKRREKENLLCIRGENQETIAVRSVHAVSLFLLGLSLREIAEMEIIRSLSAYRACTEDLFEYAWMLASVYHDCHFSQENRFANRGYSLKDYLQRNSITKSIYWKREPELASFVPTYKQETIEGYFEHRTSEGKMDHGISSGFFLYNTLATNLENVMGERPKGSDFFTVKGNRKLYWNSGQILPFAAVSDAIIAHNIWHKPSVEFGHKDGLEEISTDADPSEQKKLSLKDSPLAFYLSLLDTIEPLKCLAENGIEKIEEQEASRILDNVDISYSVNDKNILITQSASKLYDFNRYKERIGNFDIWMDNVKNPIYDAKTDTIAIKLS